MNEELLLNHVKNLLYENDKFFPIVKSLKIFSNSNTEWNEDDKEFWVKHNIEYSIGLSYILKDKLRRIECVRYLVGNDNTNDLYKALIKSIALEYGKGDFSIFESNEFNKLV